MFATSYSQFALVLSYSSRTTILDQQEGALVSASVLAVQPLLQLQLHPVVVDVDLVAQERYYSSDTLSFRQQVGEELSF